MYAWKKHSSPLSLFSSADYYTVDLGERWNRSGEDGTVIIDRRFGVLPFACLVWPSPWYSIYLFFSTTHCNYSTNAIAAPHTTLYSIMARWHPSCLPKSLLGQCQTWWCLPPYAWQCQEAATSCYCQKGWGYRQKGLQVVDDSFFTHTHAHIIALNMDYDMKYPLLDFNVYPFCYHSFTHVHFSVFLPHYVCLSPFHPLQKQSKDTLCFYHVVSTQ